MSVTGLADTIRWYDDNAEQYAEAGATYFDLNHINSFAQLLPTEARVLDAGCGAGRDSILLQQKGFEVTGLDLSTGLLEVAKRKFPNIKFVEGNLLNLPFEDAEFDGVWSNTSLLHLETVDNVKQAMAEMYRVLKPSGVLHVVVKAQTGRNKTAVVTDKLSGHDRFFQYFTLRELEELIKGQSFNMISIKEYSETETIPHGRPEVRIIWVLARKD